MKSHTEYLTFNVPGQIGFVNITPQCEEAVRKSGVAEGLLLCNAMHITASVFINDNESGLHEDYKKWLEHLAPHAPTSQYQHNRTLECLPHRGDSQQSSSTPTGDGTNSIPWCPTAPALR